MNGRKMTERMEQIAIEKLIPYARNARTHSDEQILQLRASLREFGFVNPVLVDRDYNIIAGHGRVVAAKAEKLTEIPCVFVEHLTEAQKKAYVLADNRIALNAGWDEDMLVVEIEELKALDFDIDLMGFDADELEKLFTSGDASTSGAYGAFDNSGALAAKFIVPPFSTLDARAGYWQERKAAWKEIIDGGGRKEDLLGGLGQFAKAMGTSLKGTSIFDPVLCEVLVSWFSNPGAKIIDPFAGGSVRGMVSGFLGRVYIGNDLSATQIEYNCSELEKALSYMPKEFVSPKWTVGDSSEIEKLVPDDDFDMLLTCPPYADLEKYSDDPRDISNMDYAKFMVVYRTILEKTIAKLKEDAIIAIVVGDVRDKAGILRDFVSDTIVAVKDAGVKLYNSMVLLTAVSTAAVRAERNFAHRKVTPTHQNVLVFVKGDIKKINLQPVEIRLDILE